MANTPNGIAVFSDLNIEEPRISSEGMKMALDEILGEDRLSPRNIETRMCWIPLSGDSRYGARIGIVKEVIAGAMYDPGKLAGYFTRTAEDMERTAARKRKWNNSLVHRARSGLKSVSEKIRRCAGLRFYADPEIDGTWDNQQVASLEVYGKVFREMADIARGVYHELGTSDIVEIAQTSELHHAFSGKWNGTGRNLTFTNEKVRPYGERLQQAVRRIMNAFIGNEDCTHQLSVEQLYPVMHSR